MTEFWDEAFKNKREMWGSEPAKSALLAAATFSEKGFKKILVPGIGYGRNARPFLDKGMKVTGIEISEKAIAIAEEYFGAQIKIYHGSVSEMPFEDESYDGIFCHALIHLLDESERIEFLKNCYTQLRIGGYMVFTAISRNAKTYGQGKFLSNNRYEQFGGAKIFFYDEESVSKEFGKFGLIETVEVPENQPMYLIKCCKE